MSEQPALDAGKDEFAAAKAGLRQLNEQMQELAFRQARCSLSDLALEINHHLDSNQPHEFVGSRIAQRADKFRVMARKVVQDCEQMLLFMDDADQPRCRWAKFCISMLKASDAALTVVMATAPKMKDGKERDLCRGAFRSIEQMICNCAQPQ